MDVDWGRVAALGPEILEQLREHLLLTAIAVAVGFLISFPLAIYAHRHRYLYGPVTAVTGIMYTIPSISLFVFLQPITGYFSVLTAEVGLVSYTLLILIRNIVAGLNSVPADTKEAAVGMGYSRSQLLWKVELPLALPVIMAGVRLATVTTIGLVTVTALIGQGGFGLFILKGLRFFDDTQMLVGGACSMLLAVAVDASLVLTERSITPWARRRAVRSFA